MTSGTVGRAAPEIWQAVLAHLKDAISAPNYAAYVKDTRSGGFDGQTFTVIAPNVFIRDWLETRLSLSVKGALMKVTGQKVDVRYLVGDVVPPKTNVPSALEEWAQDAQPFAPRATRLNPRYTFDTFIVGSSNRLAHAAAEGVSGQPGYAYNPLFIYGGPGLGKTHLLQAVGHSAIMQGLTVLYVSSETFTNEMVKAIRERTNEQFRQKYRGVDVLLIDDIQFIAGRESTQEEFFHTFNDLHSQNKQIVISSDRSPKSMPSLEERLRSRFEWGLITDVQPPDFETRLAILETKAKALNQQATDTVLEMIAHKVQSNIRELEGSLNKVVMYARSHGLPLTLETAQLAMADAAPTPMRRRITPAQIVNAVAEYYHLDVHDLRGKKRDRDIATPRQVAMYLMRDETQVSLGEIGRELGGRDHTTVMHGCEKINRELKTNQQLIREINDLKTVLYHREPGDGKNRQLAS